MASRIDTGSGPPVVLVPGLQGRWEWMRPSVDALAADCRVLSYTLAGDWGSDQPFDPQLGFDSFVVQLDRVLDDAGVGAATICGVSYGGLIALRYAARRPHRVQRLVLASALPPDYEVDARYRFYRRAPTLLLPLFALESARRVAPELRAALPTAMQRLQLIRQVMRVVGAPMWPPHMRRRMELLATVDFRADVADVSVPSLAITGEPGLDRTVPVELTLRYLQLLRGCEHAVLERSGHMGTATRPREFAALVSAFVRRTPAAEGPAAASRKAG